jgi:hypothetical protein
MQEDFKRYVFEEFGIIVNFIESDNPDTFEKLFGSLLS